LGRAGLSSRYDALMTRAAQVQEQLARAATADAAQKSEYVIPLSYRKRTLFKMDLAEVVYIAELRTAPAGHFSYRRIAWEMFRALARRHPSLAKHFRATDPYAPVDLLNR
jgi:thymidylate synthase ThyX